MAKRLTVMTLGAEVGIMALNQRAGHAVIGRIESGAARTETHLNHAAFFGQEAAQQTSRASVENEATRLAHPGSGQFCEGQVTAIAGHNADSLLTQIKAYGVQLRTQHVVGRCHKSTTQCRIELVSFYLQVYVFAVIHHQNGILRGILCHQTVLPVLIDNGHFQIFSIDEDLKRLLRYFLNGILQGFCIDSEGDVLVAFHQFKAGVQSRIVVGGRNVHLQTADVKLEAVANGHVVLLGNHAAYAVEVGR